ncbi:MAG: hypothetical protein F6K48_24995 [Okeania sp. SIO3H1]|uniref:hypothetical protein n=1 Tax=Okeania sp. SIO1I7 TaxID=2607772 RepID=UPI0013CD1099|nr:hypothetical protein [Okeania sp. SIO1I7]NEN91984.1 hypothetical protein [Okeania sp. SIO3H1]NET27845.1 hypothetical protein [Okeania sp. SIO1I7]
MTIYFYSQLDEPYGRAKASNHRVMADLKVDLHPDKILLGGVAKGFDMLRKR